ncbi:MAG TPA: hypothetical protein PLL30_09225 [Candidatus Krumholzibacteria bacterium]|nr:hypothetical protein [Candidatus Krumholzibacteria bacterium]HPD71942.1 hypothetical protein [Candidatus Krumholzibacteria bacterium]HRY41125.1 hypothetical protein [Candidatus Krumholzibacteria bacterium]
MTAGTDLAGTGRRAWLVAALALSLFASAFWIVFWRQSADSALVRVPVLDERWYLDRAAQLRAEGCRQGQIFLMSPGYPLVVAAAGGRPPGETGVLTTSPRALLALQAAAWLAAGLLAGAVVHSTGRRAGLSERAATAAGVLAASLFLLYRPAAIYARTVLLEIPLAFCATASLAAATCGPRRLVRRAILAGLLLGAAALLRAHVLVLLAPVGVALARAPDPGRRRALAVGILLGLALLPPGLAAWHNTRATGRLAGPTLNAGINLYLGQLAESHGLFTVLDGLALEQDPSGEAYLERRLGRALDGPGAVDRAWLAEARRLVAADPGGAAARWLRKCWLHLQAWEISQVTPLGHWAADAPVLRLLVVPWGLLSLVAIQGLAVVVAQPGGRSSRAWPPATPGLRSVALVWAASGALLVAVQSAFFVVSRYRLVLAPIWAVLAGLGVAAACQLWRSGHRRRLGRLAAILPLVACLVVPWGLGRTRQEWSAQESYNLARRLLVVAGQPGAPPDARERADGLLAETCGVVPHLAGPWRLRALNLAAIGRTDEALEILSRGVMAADQPRTLEGARIGLLREIGRLDAAEALMQAYLRDEPGDADMLHDLAVLQGQRGRWAAAEATARRLMAAAPDDHRGWLDLGVALARQDRNAEAGDVLRDGLRRFPADPARARLEANLRRLPPARPR